MLDAVQAGPVNGQMCIRDRYLIDWDKLNCEIVQECTDGLQVLKYLEKNTADIVITDIKMPKLSGIELMLSLIHI